MNKKTLIKILATISAFALSGSLFAACKDSAEGLGKQKDYEWSYVKEFVDEHDPEMTIDGVLDETLWQGQTYLYHKEKNVSMSYTTVFTSYGLYIGAVAEDVYMQWSGRFNFFGPWTTEANNSAFMFKVQGADVVEEHTTTVFNFFVDSKNAASRNQTHFEAKATTNGDIDKGEANKMVAELFVSWDALNIDIPEGKEYPDYVRIQPLYRYVEEANSANNKWLTPLFSEYSESRLLHRSRFSVDGYINADKDNAVLGDAANGISKSDGWDLTQLDNGVVKSDTYHGQAIFFKDISSDSYIYSTNLKITDESWGLNGHGGVCDMIDSELFNAFYIAGGSVYPGTTTLNYHTLNFIRDENYSNWHDINEGYYKVPEGKDPYNDGIDITVVKQKEKFFYYIYEDLVLCKEIPVLGGATCPGLYALSRCVEFADYIVQDYAEAQTELDTLIYEDAYKVSAPGNISGGIVNANKGALIKRAGVNSEDLVLTITPNAGYVLTALNITGTTLDSNYIPYFLENCQDGILTIDKELVVGNVEITAKYTYLSRCDLYDTSIVKVNGILKDVQGKAFSGVEIYLKNANATFCYKLETTSNGSFSFSVPKEGALRLPDGQEVLIDGKYTIYINIPGYRVVSEDVYLDKQTQSDVQKEYIIEKSTIGGNAVVNGGTIVSDTTDWDYSLDSQSIVSTTKRPNAIAYFTDVTTDAGAIVQATVKNTTDTSLESYELEPGIGFIVNNSWRTVKFILAGNKLKILQDGSWMYVLTYTSPVEFNTRIGNGECEYTIRLVHENAMFAFQILDGDDWVTICYYADETFDAVCAYGLTATAGGNPVGVEFSNYSLKVGESTREVINELFYAPFTVTINYFDGTQDIIEARNGEGLLATPSQSLEAFVQNGINVVPKVNGNTVVLTDAYFKSLMGPTVITFGYDTTGVIAYNNSLGLFETIGLGGTENKYSTVAMADTVSGDFELSVDVKWADGTSWPVEAISITDEWGQTIQFIAGRIYVACQTNWDWINMGENDGNFNVYWHREMGNSFGILNEEGGRDFNFKVIVEDGVATIYINEADCGNFILSEINADFDLTSNISISLCVREVHGDNPYITLSNWVFLDELSNPAKDEYTITIEHLDGSTEEIFRNLEGLSSTPKKGYDYVSENGLAVVAKVGGNIVTITEDYLLSLKRDTTIQYSYLQTGKGALTYNSTAQVLEANTVTADAYSEVQMANTVSGDFELSVDVKWASGTSWPIEAFSVEDVGGESIQFIVGRIYVGCQANWAWTKMGESDGNSNVYWHRELGYAFGTSNAEGGYDFTFKVVVKDGVATLYIDNVNCGSFTLSEINPNFDLTDTLSTKLCVKYVQGSNPHIIMSNWIISDEVIQAPVQEECIITLNYLDGTTQAITKTAESLSEAPLKGYDYTSDNGVKVIAKVNGEAVTVTETYLLSLTQDTTITYSYVQSGQGALAYNPTTQVVETTKTTGDAYSEIAMADTVSGDFELSVNVKWYGASWPIEAISIEDEAGQTIQFIVGRIYVGCQANWAWTKMGESDGNSNVYWHRELGYAFGTENTEGGRDFTFKVVVEDGVATLYINDVDCGSFTLSAINPNFDLTDTLSTKLCVKYVQGSNPHITMSNWAFANKEN